MAISINLQEIPCQDSQHRFNVYVVKPVLSGHSKRTPKLIFNTDYRLMQVKSIAECSKGSILQYFRPSLSYHCPLRPWFCLFFKWALKTGFTASDSVVYDCLCELLPAFYRSTWLVHSHQYTTGKVSDQPKTPRERNKEHRQSQRNNVTGEKMIVAYAPAGDRIRSTGSEIRHSTTSL